MITATHNSATGEKPSNLISWLVIPFARTQTKTLTEQFAAGCRYFDFRLRFKGLDIIFAHGLFTSSKNVHEALAELDKLAETDPMVTYINVCYEGRLEEERYPEWVDGIKYIIGHYPNLVLAGVAVKKPKWVTLFSQCGCPRTVQGFKSLDGSSWHTLIPVPYLWHKIYGHTNTNIGFPNTAVYLDFL